MIIHGKTLDDINYKISIVSITDKAIEASGDTYLFDERFFKYGQYRGNTKWIFSKKRQEKICEIIQDKSLVYNAEGAVDDSVEAS